MDKKINVGLYGDGSRNSRLREEIIHCDRADECSVYRDGKCLSVTYPMCSHCPLGRLELVDGGTKRSKKYEKVRTAAHSDECYGKLRSAHYIYFAVAGDMVIVGGMYPRLKYDAGQFEIDRPGFLSGKYTAIPKSEFTTDIIDKICRFRPLAIMGGVIKDYAAKQLPLFFAQMRKAWPEKYAEYAAVNPDVVTMTPDYVGRLAKVSTLNRDVEVMDGTNVFRFDGDTLFCEKWHGCFMPFGTQYGTLHIPVTDDLKVKVWSNDQVTEDTVFV